MTDLVVPHGPEFFDQMRTRREAYRLLGDAFAAVLGAPTTLWDIGCGVGFQTVRLQELGWNVFGLDPCCAEPEPGFPFMQVDPLTRRPCGWDKWPRSCARDVVVCTETAEHVYPERADRLVEVVAGLARKRLIWSAAGPGNEWEGHVNLQPAEYWVDKLAARGMALNFLATSQLRLEMSERGAQHCGAVENFHVFDRIRP